MAAYRKFTSRETYIAMSLLEKHCAVVDGEAVYDEDWDDHRIAEEITKATGHAKPLAGVSRIRKENFGNLRKGRGTPVSKKLIIEFVTKHNILVSMLKTELNLEVDHLFIDPETGNDD